MTIPATGSIAYQAEEDRCKCKCPLLFYVLSRSKVISRRVPNYASVHSWRLNAYSSAPLVLLLYVLETARIISGRVLIFNGDFIVLPRWEITMPGARLGSTRLDMCQLYK